MGQQVVWESGYWTSQEPSFLPLSAVLAFDVPAAPLLEPQGGPDRTGRLYYPGEPVVYGFANDITDCGGLGVPTICASSIDAEVQWDLAGAVWLFDAPLVGEVPVSTRRTKLSGDPGDEAQMVQASGDLEGDGLHDLVIWSILDELVDPF